jgi:hypothetical protein
VVSIFGGFNEVNLICTENQIRYNGLIPPVSLSLGAVRLRFGRSIGGRSYGVSMESSGCYNEWFWTESGGRGDKVCCIFLFAS